MTGDEPQETMGRVQTPVVSFPPPFARTFSSKERRLGTRQPLSRVVTSGRKNVMSMRELFCSDPLAGFEKMAGFQNFFA